jgi:hypothetical protein
MIRFILSLMLFWQSTILCAAAVQQGFSLTEIGEYKYDASMDPLRKTDAQKAVDQIYSVGGRHVSLSPRAIMRDPKGIEVIPLTPLAERAVERERYRRFIAYIKSKGMTVGIRPIFFVVDSAGRTPVIESLPDGTQKNWWHGNIQPRDPNAWFESFKTYLDIYMTIAKITQVEEFTIGAELYSMTVGIEDQWKEHPHGFPGRWLELLKYTRQRLGPNVRLMYDINFTDDKAVGPTAAEFGGEIARWRYRIVDLANPTDPAQLKIWQDLCNFWKEMDVVGIDMYRSFGNAGTNYSMMGTTELADTLRETSDRYATQLDNVFVEIESVVGVPKTAIFKEVGFRSITRGFVNPFEYVSRPGEMNSGHQAAAYRAFFKSFHEAGFPWYKGVYFWDVSVDPKLQGPSDQGFSPLGKSDTEKEIREAFKD